MSIPKIIDLQPNESLQKFIKELSPLIVDFYADWCPPCRSLGPLIESECKKNNINLCKVNIDKNKELKNQYKITGIPRILLFMDQKQVMAFTGYNTSKLNIMIKVALKQYKGNLEDLNKDDPVIGSGYLPYLILFLIWFIYMFFFRK